MTRIVDRATKDGLNPVERLFVHEYIKDHSATNAAKRAGIDPVTGGLVLRRPAVQAEVTRLDAEVLAEARERAGLSIELLLTEVKRGAAFDVRKLFNADGSPKAVHELDDDTASSVAGIEVIEKYVGSGEDRTFVGNVIRYKLADRARWVDMGLKVMGGYKLDNDQTNPINPLVALLSQMRRSALPVVQEVPRDDAL